MQRRWISTLTIAAALLAGCGDDDGAGPGPTGGEFELTIAGAIAETASGPAFFGSDVDDEGEPMFVLLLGDERSRHLVMAGKPGASRPGVGSYDIQDPATADGGWTAMHLVSEDEELVGMFFAESGTLTVTESTSERIRGSMEFDGVGLFGDEETEVEVQVTTTFVAARAR